MGVGEMPSNIKWKWVDGTMPWWESDGEGWGATIQPPSESDPDWYTILVTFLDEDEVERKYRGSSADECKRWVEAQVDA